LASLVLYGLSTLYLDTDAGDGFGEPGSSEERRLEPQITIGLLTDQGTFPLMISAFEGNKAERDDAASDRSVHDHPRTTRRGRTRVS
jgi:hypothetical protein